MAEMLKCEVCGMEMERGTKYCACGVLLPTVVKAKTETTKCPRCNFDNALDAKVCASPHDCRTYLKSDLECLRSNELSLRTIKRLLKWWMFLTIVGIVLGFLAAIGAFR